MNVALYGGTFDPIHNGHLAVARAAAERLVLKQVHFVVTATPPNKSSAQLTDFEHRFAMVALATAEEKDFIPSLLESPSRDGSRSPNYAIDTVRAFKRTLKKADRLFYIIGIDAFADITTWREPEALLREAEFIIVSRPGFSMAEFAFALPESLRPSDAVIKASAKQQADGTVVLPGAVIHLISDLKQPAASREVRAAIRSGKKMDRFLAPAVVDYMKKQHLYRMSAEGSAPSKPAKSSGSGSKRSEKKPATVLEFNPTGKRTKHK